MARTVDLFLIYQFLKRLTTPFDQTDAFRLGIIDANGKVLKSKSDLKTEAEKNAYTYFDTLVFNLKKLIIKLGGKNKIITYAAALLLLKEHNDPSKYLISEEKLEKRLNTQLKLMGATPSKFNRMIEDAPTNCVSGGQIAGTTDPIVRRKKLILRRNAKNINKVQ